MRIRRRGEPGPATTKARIENPTPRLPSGGISRDLLREPLHALTKVRGQSLFHDGDARLGTRALQNQVLSHAGMETGIEAGTRLVFQ